MYKPHFDIVQHVYFIAHYYENFLNIFFFSKLNSCLFQRRSELTSASSTGGGEYAQCSLLEFDTV
jgi:hypothetical protein